MMTQPTKPNPVTPESSDMTIVADNAVPTPKKTEKMFDKLGRPTKRTKAKVYRIAAQRIENNGYLKGARWRISGGGIDKDCPVCAVGAIDQALYHMGTDEPYYGTDRYGDGQNYRDFDIESSVTGIHNVESFSGPIVRFNDAQTGADAKLAVIEALRECAYRLEHGGKPSPKYGGPKYQRKPKKVDIASVQPTVCVEAESGPVETALRNAKARLTPETWIKGTYFTAKNNKLCMCAHGAVQAEVNPVCRAALSEVLERNNYVSTERTLGTASDSTFAVGPFAALELAARLCGACIGIDAAAAATVTESLMGFFDKKTKEAFDNRPDWVKKDRIASGQNYGNCDAHFILGMVGLYASSFNDAPETTFEMVMEKFNQAIALAHFLGV